ncbi:MAG: hypothetical protein IPK19_09150 [Chloroflexi bacterium]|nr:hypothetical protein [Chloroflexota bacterium]
MTKFVASTPNAQVSGDSIQGYLNCIRYDEIKDVLEKHSLTDIQATEWWPHQTMLSVLAEIGQGTVNVSESLVSIGIKVMEMTTMPPQIDSIQTVLGSLGAVYQMHHRNVSEVGWISEELGPRHMRVYHEGPYPEDLCYGIVWGGVQRFRPAGSRFTITPIPGETFDAPTVYDIVWD